MSFPSKMSQLDAIPTEALYEVLRPITVPQSSKDARFINWGRTFACSPLAIFEPESERHCQLILELARREGKVVRAVGVGHSPSDLPCTSGYMLRTTKLDRLLEVSLPVPAYLVPFPTLAIPSFRNCCRPPPFASPPSDHSC